MPRIPLAQGGKVLRDESEVPELVDRGGARLEALELAATRFGGFIVDDEFGGHLFG